MFAQSFASFLLKRNLQHLILHVTNHCNLRCNHCFIDFSTKRDVKLDRYQPLGKEVGPLFWLDIGGGEPFVRKDLTDILDAFTAKVIQIPTNGELQDQILTSMKKWKKMSLGEITISLSCDGLQENHDRIRNHPGNFDKVWDTFEKIRSLGGVKVKINTVITNQNFDELIPLMKLVRAQNPDFHSVILVRGSTIDPSVALPPLEELHNIAPEIFRILETYDYGKGGIMAMMLRNYHRYLWNTSLATIKQKTQVIPCLAGQAHMVMMGNGDVSACEMLEPVGNVGEQKWQDIMKGEKLKKQIQDIKDKKCHCTHNCAMLDSILFRPASIPHLLYERIRDVS